MSTRVKSIRYNRFFLYLALALCAVFFLIPIYMLINTSLKSYQDVSLSTMWDLPKQFGLDSFQKAWFGNQAEGFEQHLVGFSCRTAIRHDRLD